ncbi:MAG: histidine phosphatase family protein [Candidatus Anstonellales archaeon]
MNIYLVRHAQKDTSSKSTQEDHYNRGLTEVGLEQAKELANHLSSYSITKIFTSDMPRAISTAEAIASKLGVSDVIKDRDLREADPCIIPDHPDRDKIKIQCWKEWDFKPENGESYNEGKGRFSDYFWNKIIKNNPDNDNVLIVSHGRVMRLFLSDYLEGGKEAIKTPYSHVAITHLKVNKRSKQIEIIKYNDNTYLPAELRV